MGAGNWYGALYYKIISEKSETGTIYTLLGWESTTLSEMQKIIEILTFDDKNLPHFGKKIFNKYKDGENRRVIFKYSPVATMVLRYEEQSLSKGKKWNASHRTFEESHSKASMIVCDRLVTLETSEGKGQVLVPAGDVYDGFIFENDRWNFVEGVDARNR
jgi:predicted transcriptional regulator